MPVARLSLGHFPKILDLNEKTTASGDLAMSNNVFRTAAFATFAIALVALPSHAQTIKAGKDLWVTPPNGKTVFTFPKGDLEALCGASTSSTPITVTLKGVPSGGADYDTIVARLDNAVFSSGVAKTRIQVAALDFVSAKTVSTPCGSLDFTVGLTDEQAITEMTLVQTSEKGGVFSADIAVNVEFQAFKAGTYLGSLFYNLILPDPANGTAWSFGSAGEFRAGLTTADDCVDVLRKKLLTPYGQDPQHFYFISKLIANKDCTTQPPK